MRARSPRPPYSAALANCFCLRYPIEMALPLPSTMCPADHQPPELGDGQRAYSKFNVLFSRHVDPELHAGKLWQFQLHFCRQCRWNETAAE